MLKRTKFALVKKGCARKKDGTILSAIKNTIQKNYITLPLGFNST